MARKRSEQPAYSYHMSGQARVRLDGKAYYLGPHGSPASYAKYYALLAEYNANDKRVPSSVDDDQEPERMADDIILVKHITAEFLVRKIDDWNHDKNRKRRYKLLCEALNASHGNEPASEFGPRKLDVMREGFIDNGLGEKGRGVCRKIANELVRNIITIFTHGVSRELIPPDRIVALKSLEPLKRGKGKAIDHPKRQGVPVASVEATLPKMTTTLAAMVRVQLATAMRPSELFRMTPAMIDRSGEVWIYRPDKHKTQHHGKTKAVPILGDGLQALTPFLFGDPNEPCFMTEKNTPWNKDSYRIAITRAAKAAGVAHWTPYQIRHTTLQAVRDNGNAEQTQALAGHSRMDMTEHYAKASEAKAIEAARVAPRLCSAQ